jgi:hypothetical protein
VARPGAAQLECAPNPYRRRRIHNIMDRLGEVSRHALIRLADALRISSVAATRTIVNLLLAAARIIVNSLIYCVNFVVRMVTLAARAILSGIVSAWWFLSKSYDPGSG